MLHNSIIDLKARLMRDNLIFHNIKESPEENSTAINHQLLEEKFNIEDTTTKVKVDRSHKLGKPRKKKLWSTEKWSLS